MRTQVNRMSEGIAVILEVMQYKGEEDE